MIVVRGGSRGWMVGGVVVNVGVGVGRYRILGGVEVR